jgi:hypothetical protein
MMTGDLKAALAANLSRARELVAAVGVADAAAARNLACSRELVADILRREREERAAMEGR